MVNGNTHTFVKSWQKLEVGRNFQRSASPALLPVQSGCSGPWPTEFSISPKVAIPQPLWVPIPVSERPCGKNLFFLMLS